MTQEAIPWHWFVLEVNPEPWAIGDLSVGRKNGKVFPMVGRNNQLYMFQQAIKEEIGDPGIFFDGPVELQFYFWRRRDEYKTPQARTHRKHEADGTNLSKATEDALQGVFFKNDKDVNHCEWTIVEQGADVEPKIVIGIRRGRTIPDAALSLPTEVAVLLNEIDNNNNNSHQGEEVF